MKKLSRILCAMALLGSSFVTGCEEKAEAKVQVEKLPDVTPSLPPVPTLPPPPHPTQYSDQSYSVYGLRRQLRKTIDTEVSVTGYIAKVFVPPECPEKQKCPLPPAPHLWMADTQGEQDPAKLLLMAGYAENQLQIDEAIENEKKGKPQDPEELAEMGMTPIPTDLFAGAKLKVKGRFAYISGSGFQSSEGVLGYNGHETLEPAPEAATAEK
ncbi:MAG: hypothetical protein OEZ06_26260 [Myxococcales bacterium]|nr:hypothetical protein [Myxococcales bacterium]